MSSNTPLAALERVERRNLQENSRGKKIRHNFSQILSFRQNVNEALTQPFLFQSQEDG